MRRFPIKIIVLLLASFIISFNLKAEEAPTLKIIGQSKSNVFKPLDWIEITGAEKGVIVVYDGTGREYALGSARETLKFQVGGSLGIHTAILMNKKEQERKNLAKNEKYKEVMAGLLEKIRKWQQETGDKLELPSTI